EGDSQRQIASFVQSILTAREDTEKGYAQPSVTSVRTEFPNELGQQLFAYIDHPSQPLSGRPVVVVVPGYGETKKEYVHLSYYLASNGLEVLRYDHSNHIGESDGDHTNSTLGRMHRDLCAALDFVAREWPGSAIIVIATSLSGRIALKVAAKGK